MKINARSRFTHPVLNSEYETLDYVAGSFQFELEEIIKTDSEKIAIEIKNITIEDDSAIIDVLENDSADIYVDIECSSTMLRRCEKMNLGTGNSPIEFENGDLYGTVTIQCFASVSKDIFNFTSNNFNDDYGRAGVTAFDLKPGDILAISESKEIIFSAPNKMQEFWNVDKDDKLENWQSELNLDNHIAIIKLSSKLHKRFHQLSASGPKGEEELQRSIFFPAFVEAIYQVEKPEFETLNWAIALKSKIDEKVSSLPEKFEWNEEENVYEPVYDLAQSILKDPLRTLLLEDDDE